MKNEKRYCIVEEADWKFTSVLSKELQIAALKKVCRQWALPLLLSLISCSALANLVGSARLADLGGKRSTLSPSEQLEILFNEAPAPATSLDFKKGQEDLKCLAIGHNLDFENEFQLLSFYKVIDNEADLGPLFDHHYYAEESLTITYSHMRKHLGPMISNGRDLVVKSESLDDFKSAVFSFRKSADLVVWSLSGGTRRTSYGYCWQDKDASPQTGATLPNQRTIFERATGNDLEVIVNERLKTLFDQAISPLSPAELREAHTKWACLASRNGQDLPLPVEQVDITGGPEKSVDFGPQFGGKNHYYNDILIFSRDPKYPFGIPIGSYDLRARELSVVSRNPREFRDAIFLFRKNDNLVVWSISGSARKTSYGYCWEK